MTEEEQRSESEEPLQDPEQAAEEPAPHRLGVYTLLRIRHDFPFVHWRD